jgi:hypothetical protein
VGTATPPAGGPPLPANKVGFHYRYFGVFWLDLWTWDGNWCLYQGDRYWTLEKGQAALLLGKPESDLSKPFLYTFPLGLLILVPLMVLGAAASIFDRAKPNPAAEILKDERYQRALVLFHEQMNRDDAPAAPEGATQTDVPPPAAADEARRQQKIAAAFEAAVTSLTSQGIERGEAEEKLSLLLSATQPAPAA